MRTSILLLLALGAQAQPLPQSKPITGIEFDPAKLINLNTPTIHIHPILHASCQGQPDQVYADSKDGKKQVYYACMSGQDVCTDARAHNGVGVPRALITQYEQVKALQAAEWAAREKEAEELRAQRVRDGLSTGDPKLDAALARQRAEAIANEVRTARAQGRQPNLAQFNKPGVLPVARAQVAPAATIAPATAKRASAVPLADEKLDGIAPGESLNAVLEKLGNPYTRIAGDSERWTYRLESGGIARLSFERGILASIERSKP